MKISQLQLNKIAGLENLIILGDCKLPTQILSFGQNGCGLSFYVGNDIVDPQIDLLICKKWNYRDINSHERRYLPLINTKCRLIHSNPKLVYAKIVNKFFKIKKPKLNIGKNTTFGQNFILGTSTSLVDDWSSNIFIQIPQLGNVTIGSNVTIYDNVQIDRGTINDTQIGNGCIIGSQCYIAHNVYIGNKCVLPSSVKILGSAKIGDNCYISPGVLIKQHITIGNNCFIGMGCVVNKDIPDNTCYVVDYNKVQRELPIETLDPKYKIQ